MFHQERSVVLRSSASALNNNLSLFSECSQIRRLRIAVIHRSTVNLVTLTDNGQRAQQVTSREGARRGLLFQVKWCEVGNRLVLAVVSQYGVQVYDDDGAMLLFWHCLSSDDETPDIETFARGICTLGRDLLLVGTHDGNILTFEFSSATKHATPKATLKKHSTAIGDIASFERTLVSGDEIGTVCIWRYDDNEDVALVHTSKSFGNPCTSVSAWDTLVMAAFSTGHLRTFSIQTGVQLSEICAHARSITAVDIATRAGLALSASEDGFVRIWDLNPGSEFCDLKFSQRIPDAQLCGARFLSSKGQGFAVTAYDSEELVCFTI